jgi:tRNA A37 threonylcarbamoyladenosine biosynthesis protein TsaE
VRGLARGLQVDEPDEVRSPTYLLVVEHPGPTPLLHLDAYLPGKTRAFLEQGGADYLHERQCVVAAEWADRIADLLPQQTLWIELLPTPDGGRRAVLTGPGDFFPWLAGLPRHVPT